MLLYNTLPRKRQKNRKIFREEGKETCTHRGCYTGYLTYSCSFEFSSLSLSLSFSVLLTPHITLIYSVINTLSRLFFLFSFSSRVFLIKMLILLDSRNNDLLLLLHFYLYFFPFFCNFLTGCIENSVEKQECIIWSN